jgi:hypothetical protein
MRLGQPASATIKGHHHQAPCPLPAVTNCEAQSHALRRETFQIAESAVKSEARSTVGAERRFTIMEGRHHHTIMLIPHGGVFVIRGLVWEEARPG